VREPCKNKGNDIVPVADDRIHPPPGIIEIIFPEITDTESGKMGFGDEPLWDRDSHGSLLNIQQEIVFFHQ
jgi:hypothetical protein